VTPQVYEVEQTQKVGNLAFASVGDIVYVRAQLHHIGLRLVKLSGGGLGARQEPHQRVKSRDVV
jgi:hypothetical protein